MAPESLTSFTAGLAGTFVDRLRGVDEAELTADALAALLTQQAANTAPPAFPSAGVGSPSLLSSRAIQVNVLG